MYQRMFLHNVNLRTYREGELGRFLSFLDTVPEVDHIPPPTEFREYVWLLVTSDLNEAQLETKLREAGFDADVFDKAEEDVS